MKRDKKAIAHALSQKYTERYADCTSHKSKKVKDSVKNDIKFWLDFYSDEIFHGTASISEYSRIPRHYIPQDNQSLSKEFTKSTGEYKYSYMLFKIETRLKDALFEEDFPNSMFNAVWVKQKLTAEKKPTFEYAIDRRHFALLKDFINNREYDEFILKYLEEMPRRLQIAWNPWLAAFFKHYTMACKFIEHFLNHRWDTVSGYLDFMMVWTEKEKHEMEKSMRWKLTESQKIFVKGRVSQILFKELENTLSHEITSKSLYKQCSDEKSSYFKEINTNTLNAFEYSEHEIIWWKSMIDPLIIWNEWNKYSMGCWDSYIDTLLLKKNLLYTKQYLSPSIENTLKKNPKPKFYMWVDINPTAKNLSARNLNETLKDHPELWRTKIKLLPKNFANITKEELSEYPKWVYSFINTFANGSEAEALTTYKSIILKLKPWSQIITTGFIEMPNIHDLNIEELDLVNKNSRELKFKSTHPKILKKIWIENMWFTKEEAQKYFWSKTYHFLQHFLDKLEWTYWIYQNKDYDLLFTNGEKWKIEAILNRDRGEILSKGTKLPVFDYSIIDKLKRFTKENYQQYAEDIYWDKKYVNKTTKISLEKQFWIWHENIDLSIRVEDQTIAMDVEFLKNEIVEICSAGKDSKWNPDTFLSQWIFVKKWDKIPAYHSRRYPPKEFKKTFHELVWSIFEDRSTLTLLRTIYVWPIAIQILREDNHKKNLKFYWSIKEKSKNLKNEKIINILKEANKEINISQVISLIKKISPIYYDISTEEIDLEYFYDPKDEEYYLLATFKKDYYNSNKTDPELVHLKEFTMSIPLCEYKKMTS